MSIVIKDLCYTYGTGSLFEVAALQNVSLTINDGEYVGLIGHTGSGKSTLAQHLNGLLRPSSGKITVEGIDLTEKKADLMAVRQRVGLVFQYPEYQLFEETIYKDIAFGPKNLKLSQQETDERVWEAMTLVGLDHSLAQRSPFELSGGQKRRAAIAGVLSMRPKTLVLDEPIAGLDPQGKEEILALIDQYHARYNATILIISHNMDDIAKVADRVLVMNKGTKVMDGTPREVFSRHEELLSMGLGLPQMAQVVQELNKRGKSIPTDIITQDQLFDYIASRREPQSTQV